MPPPHSKRPIRWKKSKWCEGSRTWRAVAIVPRWALASMLSEDLSVNESSYMGVNAKHLIFRVWRISPYHGCLQKVVLVMLEKEQETHELSVCDPIGGRFGTPVVYHFDVYNQSSFVDLFKR